MIKRLFRTWLRYQLYQNIGNHVDFEEIFQWIYRSPIWEWNLRISCICSSVEYKYGWTSEDNYGIIDVTYSIKDAETLLRFFRK
nr:MAG TPA: hypothetical protein [Caudoviricetes sp.]